MRHRRRNHQASRLVWGLILIAVGLVFTLQNLDWIELDMRAVWQYWPLILVAIGLAKLFDRQELCSGLWLIVLGLWLQLNQLQLWGFTWHNSWPLLLIGIGILIVFQAVTEMGPRNASGNGAGDAGGTGPEAGTSPEDRSL